MRARVGVRLAPFGSPASKTCGDGRSWEVTGEKQHFCGFVPIVLLCRDMAQTLRGLHAR